MQNATKNKNTKPPGQPFYRKRTFLRWTGSVVALVLIILVAFRVSPWPGALVIRAVFNQGGGKTLAAMQAHTPHIPITVISDQQYRTNDKAAMLDVYFPQEAAQTDTQLPVIVWTHGGAWLSGNKIDSAPYFKLLAAEGYTVVAPNYSLAPGKTYPTPVHQLNDSYAYITANAKRFHADTNAFILAGDSAGAQLSSQMAALITNPSYAQELGIKLNLQPSQLKGVVLNCGIYKMEGLTHPSPTLPKIVGWGNDVTVWAYAGTRDFSDPVIRQMSPFYHATSAFPPTYISGGNGDPLTDAQSKPLAAKLQSLGVDVTTLFYAADHNPSLPHEYQFDLDTSDGKKALAATIDFINKQTR
jgi:acetyl esterase/lipase